MNFNEIFRTDVAYDNIKSHKKAGLHPLPRKHILEKITKEVGGQFNPPPSFPTNLFRVKIELHRWEYSLWTHGMNETYMRPSEDI